MKRTLAIASAAAIAGGVIAFSIASYATSGDTSAGPPSSDNVYDAALSTPAPGTPTGHRELLHGERVVKDKDDTIITVDVQRGTVTAVSESSMTVRSSDGTTWTWTLNSDTKVRGADLKKEAVSSIKVGNTVGVAGQRIADTRTARAIGDPPPNLSNLRQDLRQLGRDLRRLHGN